MKIGIDLDNYAEPMVELQELINNYGNKREIGYLKINPERIPVIVSENRALADMEKLGAHKIAFPVRNGKYDLITDDRAIMMDSGNFELYGNAYIARSQGSVLTALDIEEIIESLLFFCTSRYESVSEEDPDDKYDYYYFEHDEKRGYWK